MKPTNELDYMSVLNTWLTEFYRNYLLWLDEGLSQLQIDTFFVRGETNNTREKLSADLEGNLLYSTLYAHKKLRCMCCANGINVDSMQPKGNGKLQEFSGFETIEASFENTTILLELLKYYGRDTNVVELFDLFKKVHANNVKKMNF